MDVGINIRINEAVSEAIKDRYVRSRIKFLSDYLRAIDFNQTVVTAVLHSYDLDTFIRSFTGNDLELRNHFHGHVLQVQRALENY